MKFIRIFICVVLVIGVLYTIYITPQTAIFTGLVVAFSLLLSLQGAFSLFLITYAWQDTEQIEKNKSPPVFYEPTISFSALVPARHEEEVLFDTLSAVASISYPDNLCQVLVICRLDDYRTIEQATRAIYRLHRKNIRLVLFDGYPINKPHGLNIALSDAKNDVVVVFDAEDEPHKDIYNVVNTVMLRDQADIVQSGVQLMNYNSSWFSILNVLEYFFWYKSSLQFFARAGIIPLGGNTVFFKRSCLEAVGGWDEKCLTEDADIGIRLSAAGAKTRVVYDEKHITQEETASNIESFIKQRTRWMHGWIQVLFKGDWLRLPHLHQKFLAAYVLVSPIIQTFMFLYVPVSLLSILTLKLPVGVALFSTLPLYILLLQLLVYAIGLYEFTQNYKLSYSWWAPIMVFSSFYPYQFLLNFSAFRAIIRFAIGNNSWEKTHHVNAHREMVRPRMAFVK